MRSSDLRVGVVVIWRKQRWTLWEKAPELNHWWIVREQKYEKVHAQELLSASTDKEGRKLAAADHEQEHALDNLAPEDPPADEPTLAI
jgi:hypothetical protein